MEKKTLITVGADPELFLQDDSGKFISAIGKFGGTKTHPKPINKLGPGFFIQEDNVAVEFNIPYATDKKQFISYITKGLSYIETLAQKIKLKIAIVPSAEFSLSQLRHPKAREFGCDPDFNVWSISENPRPQIANKRLRSAGGHIHIGGIKDRIGLGRWLDLTIGCPSILFDQDQKRRSLYGQAGCIREKPYGLEYRTVSNFWLKREAYMAWIYEQIFLAIDYLENHQKIDNETGQKIISCINNNDLNLLRDLTRKYNLRY